MTTGPTSDTGAQRRVHSTNIEEVLRPYTDEERASLLALVRSWQDANEEEAREQAETLHLLMEAIEEDRPPGHKFFPSV